ncbi:MAG: GH3 auxin-responsive promoter family protein [Opitutaceae bacterium]|nr:GH3 auxin-responsive promoter family protein [Opitutaceae bacterium]MBP9912446.1 GH3 auxin-responsive promoter family protein [Opitutaceae bacterium]
MPVLPKSLLTLGASLMTARTAAKLRKKNTALPAQDRTLQALLTPLAGTEQGRACGLERGLTYAQFSARTPLRSYAQLGPQIERMQRGEANVLWPGRCALYAVSSGTTTGRKKQLPVTEEMLRHFRRASLASLLYYTARVGHAGVFRGRHLLFGSSTRLSPLSAPPSPPAYGADLSGLAALNLPGWADRHFYEPGAAIAQLEDWPAKVAAIADRTHHRDISLLAGNPAWLLILADAVRTRAGNGNRKARFTHLQAVWPNLECLVHSGVPLAPFADELRLACGSGVNFHEVYPAAEGFIAAQDGESTQGLRLITDAGLFFEFLPLRDFDEDHLVLLGPKVVPLAGVKTGVDYVLILTTPAGLCRYVLGDVVRFTSTEPPRLLYVGRTQLQLSAFGERVIEKELTDSIVTVCQRHAWTIVNFHVAPLSTHSLTGQNRGRHEWWIELRPGTVATPTGPVLAAELDAELQKLNADYAAKRKGGGLEPPIVRLVMPGIFEQWQRSRDQWGGQNKVPRCRSDRLIADELAQIARFRPDTQPPWQAKA